MLIMPHSICFENLAYSRPSQQGELDSVLIQHPHFSAEILLQGAHLISFKPTDENDWLWLSPLETFQPENAVRGGIPICLPWFGVNRYVNGVQKHGFIRNTTCQLTEIIENDDSVTLNFIHHHCAKHAEEVSLFSSDFIAEISIQLSGQQHSHIHYELKINHLGVSDQPYSYAFHSYFNVPDIQQTQVLGLDSHPYLDNTDNLKTHRQEGAIHFDREIDRVYESTQHAQQLVCNDHILEVKAHQADSCIVWNPGKLLANTIPDIQQYFKQFICIERGSAFADELTLQSGEVHSSSMTITKKKK